MVKELVLRTNSNLGVLFLIYTSLRSARGLVVMVACQVMDPGSILGERSFCSLNRIGAEVQHVRLIT